MDRVLNEAETRAEHVDPALRAAGWGVVEGSRILREFQITQGRLEGHGRRSRAEIADYVLVYRNKKLAVIEAKRWASPLTEGVGQAKHYAKKLPVRFTYCTNGQGIYRIDMSDGIEGEVARYPTPDELWNLTFTKQNEWRDRFSTVPYEDKGGAWASRYYQDTAIDRVLEAIAAKKPRILLTLATGTGKTAIAFQIAWKLYHSRWNLSRDGSRLPRILFLADRNILADQAFNAFSAFPEDALVRISPDEIRKRKKVPKNGSVFFTIFQTFMSGPSKDGKPSPSFGEYPPDFFDFIIIDECHRGGANDESTWRDILEYFSPAVQLGLTATPKRKDNVDTYAYFGEPVFIYSLKEGINDGFLTPFRVKEIATTLDEYVYTSDDTVIEGEIEAGRRYTEKDFARRIIEIKEREQYRVELFMGMIDQTEKTLVFCATQDQALGVRDLINQTKTSKEPEYCVRVTAADGKIGDQHLRDFQDSEKTIPTVLTTSQKLSTGVDARNVRNIVLMRPVNSMIEFKQIIGRGTRLYQGKDYFTIYDFVKAHHHFNDPEWDGEPVEPEPGTVSPGRQARGYEHEPNDNIGWVEDNDIRPTRIKVKLADGKERTIDSMVATTFWSADGRPMSAVQFLESLFGKLPELFKSEDELRALWSSPETRKALLEQLAEKGFGREPLAAMQRVVSAENSDIYDVLAFVAFASPPVAREARAAQADKELQSSLSNKQRAFIAFVLEHYVKEGVEQLDVEKLAPLLQLKYGSIEDAKENLGPPSEIRRVFVEFQRYLYQQKNAA
ncbi:DEAD/DEAH box helicase family protein [Myxococcus sp. CA051A]|uniref:EcoAI/FtnUII family type I restriction enzme subunit R n=1 Tax=Myxococcus sp. CA051A TaxID=2741739 RepID=UPI00157B8E40|nr:type I restriction endonuclease subunit R [Myxococcus sp. CA051A]NTX64920.1 DEAD/DEAH box helicase family protein [Myxococcus sp. CA051A]